MVTTTMWWAPTTTLLLFHKVTVMLPMPSERVRRISRIQNEKWKKGKWKKWNEKWKKGKCAQPPTVFTFIMFF
jgi:hypothetical protein